MTEQMTSEDYQGMLDDLTKGSKFSRVTEAKVLHNRPKVETPITALNALLGGGLPLGMMAELYGEPSAGKSSFSYQVMGRFQEQYPDGVAVIVDVESSVDEKRMKYFGCDPERVLRLPADTMEEGFKQVIALLKKKSSNDKIKDLPVMILWDTIAISPTDAQFKKVDINGGGMMERARLIKGHLSNMLPLIEKQPTLVLLLNQITTKKTRYGSSLGSGGGYGLKHDIHFKLRFMQSKVSHDGEFAVSAKSMVSIDKSKLSPLYSDMPIVLDMRRAGVIDTAESIMKYCNSRDIIYSSGNGWYSMPSEDKFDYEGKFGEELASYIDKSNKRYDDMIELLKSDPIYKKVLTVFTIDMFGDVYEYQKELMNDYRAKLINDMNKELMLNKLRDIDDEDIEVVVDQDKNEIIKVIKVVHLESGLSESGEVDNEEDNLFEIRDELLERLKVSVKNAEEEMEVPDEEDDLNDEEDPSDSEEDQDEEEKE